MTTATPGGTPRDLTTRVQALPQELIDMIQDDVFRCRPGPRKITSARKTVTKGSFVKRELVHVKHIQHPDTLSLMCVSKATREAFIASYFAATFHVPEPQGYKFLLHVKRELRHFAPLIEGVILLCRRERERRVGEDGWKHGGWTWVNHDLKDKVKFVTARSV